MPAPKNRKDQIGIMKAKPITESLLYKLGPTCIAQRKYRGQRCRTEWVNGLPLLMSSYGIPFSFMEHIQEALCHYNLHGLRLDGELYNHEPEFTQEHINSILNRSTNRHPESHLIQYHIFDIISPDPQWQRLMELDFAALHVRSPLACAPHELIQTPTWLEKCSQYLSQGYEGIILRHPELAYRPLVSTDLAKRPSKILKFKPREKDYYEIIAYREGTGWATGMLGGLQVQGNDSDPFWVGTGPVFTKRNRQKYWLDRESLIGKYLCIFHEPIRTVTGLPICTSAQAILNENPEDRG